MTQTICLGSVAELAAADRRVFEVQGRSILVCRTGGGLFAVDNFCTHQEYPLAEGRIKGNFIFCPLHGMRFDLRTGMPVGSLTDVHLRTYPVSTVDGSINIEIEADGFRRRSVFS